MSKNKKRIIGIIGILVGIVLIAVVFVIGIVHFREAKYGGAERYLAYEELEPGQIILVQELHRQYDDGMKIRVNVLDKEGSKYSALVSEQEWNGMEEFLNEMPETTKTPNYFNAEETKEIYSYVVQMDANATYQDVSPEVFHGDGTPRQKGFSYGIRYKADGIVEYLTVWKEEHYGSCFILDDPSAHIIHRIVANPL